MKVIDTQDSAAQGKLLLRCSVSPVNLAGTGWDVCKSEGG